MEQQYYEATDGTPRGISGGTFDSRNRNALKLPTQKKSNCIIRPFKSIGYPGCKSMSALNISIYSHCCGFAVGALVRII